MKKIVSILVLVMIGLSFQSFAQSRHEEKQMNILEDEIIAYKKDIFKEEKKLEKVKKKKMYDLRKDIMHLKKNRTYDFSAEGERLARVAQLERQLDSIGLISTNEKIEDIKSKINNLESRRSEIISSWTSEEREIPQEMSFFTRNRWKNSNEVEREELAIDKAKRGLRGSSSEESPIGLIVLFDNEYSQRVTFHLRPVRGGQRLSVSLAPRSYQTTYIIPGKYTVQREINGRILQKVDLLTVDIEQQLYQLEGWDEALPFHGYAYCSKY
jgi:hypothetical protein